MPDDRSTGVWQPPPGSAAPPVVPGYVLLEELGRGGMGVVYKARQEATDRIVALKLIRDGALAGPQERARFRVEAAAATRVNHPNVVEVIEIGESNGLPFFAMEYVAGGSLERRLDGKPLPPALAATWIRTLARAVQHAHDLQIVHRDLKPANILLGDADSTSDSAILKIADFGLAKQLDTNATALTRDGAVLGTVGYMAPEQAAGRPGRIGPAVDVYALGAVLYELLTGRLPFEADSKDETIEQVIHDLPAPPTRLAAGVPIELESVCLRCLEKEPERRYGSAGELAADLDRFLAGTPVMAAAVDESERVKRFAARDGFAILNEIGRGPASIVYRATHGPLGRPVALKLFPVDVCTRDQWESRVRRGAELRAGLSHPNLVPVIGAGWWAGRPYVATEFVPQGGLVVKPDGKVMPLLQSLHLVEQIGDLIGYLHRQGVVHGNLKPSNVLIAAGGIPRVTDSYFTGGLYLGGRFDAADAHLAPELLDDPAREPRQNVDIYGLGLILYELLTGRPAFHSEPGEGIADEVRYRDPPPPSQFNPAVTDFLDAVCLKCLRKNPWKRYTRTFDLVKRLKAFQADPEIVGRS